MEYKSFRLASPLRIRLLPFALVALLASCSAPGEIASRAPNPLRALPFVVEQQGAGSWVTLQVNSLAVTTITPGQDGNLWFCEGALVGRITMLGKVTDFPLPGGYACGPVTRNPDGNVYFGEFNTNGLGGGIGQITPEGVITLYPGPPPQLTISSITSGSDGNLWGVSDGQIWRMTPQGNMTGFSAPGLTGVGYNQIIRGSDKNLWTFGRSGTPWFVWRISVLDGSQTGYEVPRTFGIASGSDGGIWVSEGSKIARLDPTTGTFTTYRLPRVVYGHDMIEGRHGILYFIDLKSTPATLGRFDTKKHKLMTSISLAGSSFLDLTIGPDGNIWITEQSRPQIDVYVVNSITTVPTSVSVGVGMTTTLTAKEKNFSHELSAQSSDIAVATVSPKGSQNVFNVLGVGDGTCTITLSDTKGNSLDVQVTVTGAPRRE